MAQSTWNLAAILIAVIMAIIDGKPLYQKFFHKKLDNAAVFGVEQVIGVFDCEKLCERHADCMAVKVVYHKKYYRCEFIASITDFNPDELTNNLYGKFIKKLGKYIVL